jgi:hypothetical protein
MFTTTRNYLQMPNSQNIYVIYIIHSVLLTLCNILHSVILTSCNIIHSVLHICNIHKYNIFYLTNIQLSMLRYKKTLNY